MATTSTEARRAQDVIVDELPNQLSRNEETIATSQTIVVGAVCRRTAKGYMAVMGTAANCVQTIAVTGTPSAGTYAIGAMVDGVMTYSDTVAYNANLAAVNTALDAAFGASQIVATGTPLSALVLTFSGSKFAGMPQELVTLDVGNLTGAEDATITMTTEGGWGAGAEVDEVQTMTLDALATAGTYTITLPTPAGGTVTTAAIAWNANIATINAAIDLVAGSGQIVSAGVPSANLTQTFTFSGSQWEGRDVPSLVAYTITSLTGPTTATPSETTKGGPEGLGVPAGIALEAVTTTTSTAKAAFLIHTARVRDGELNYGAGQKMDIRDQLRELRNIIVVDELTA